PRLAVPMGADHRFAAIAAAAHMWAITSTAAWFIYELVSRVGAWLAPRPPDPLRRRLLGVTGGALIASPLVALGYGALVGRTGFELRELDLPVPNLHPDLEGLRVLHLSDIHLSAFLSEDELARVIDAANTTRPHLA